MILLMFLVNYFRFYLTKVLNSPSNPLLDKCNMSFKTLRGTILEHRSDPNKDPKQDEDEADLNQYLKKIKDDEKFGSAMARSGRIRKASHYLPEQSVKQRKAYYCTPETGYFHTKVKFNQMSAMMQNPDMMTNMVKQNVQ